MGHRPWAPNPGPQTNAYFCKADELFFGGEAGGGKSSLITGLAVNEHERSLLLRRHRDDAKDLAEQELIGEILDGDRSHWNGSDLWLRKDNKFIEYGGCKDFEDRQRYKGTPHDLICFDEVTDFLEGQYRFIIGWNRSSNADQRCRVIATGNPPTTAEGLWVIKRWGAWLDPKHIHPAKDGELRWYVIDDEDEDIEVAGPGKYDVNGTMVAARSRTFIRSGLRDNPELGEDYASILDALPKELRDAYRDGKFSASLKDDPWQLIPTAWVVAAQNRWKDKPPRGIPMCAMGVDVAQGGGDWNVIAPRYDRWFAPLIKIPGAETPLGKDVTGIVIANRRDKAVVIVDCGGGYGGTVYVNLTENDIKTVAYKGSESGLGHSKDGLLNFYNKRSKCWWKFREELDPGQPGGSDVALPPGTQILSDLTAPRFEIVKKTIKMEPKEKLVKRLGRSTDDGDAVIMSWSEGPKIENAYQDWRNNMAGKKKPNVIMSSRGRRRARR